MIQVGSYLNVIDNSGAKSVICIKVISGYKRRYANVGDIIVISIKSLRSQRRSFSKTKKGEVHRAVVIRTKLLKPVNNFDKLGFFENSAVLLSKQNKLLGTRVFGVVPNKLRFSKFLKIASLSSGLVS